MVFKAVNWDQQIDDYTLKFFEQNKKQLWFPEELVPSKDVKVWKKLSDKEREAYRKVLGGLTLLDTEQGGVGMPQILDHVEDNTRKSVLGFMSMMEFVHAQSYSTIFTTLDDSQTIQETFEWVEENKYLQKKVSTIDRYYRNIITEEDLYMAMVASVYLESFLFYSGFFYPLYLAGQGKMIASGEIINLIIRDESIHGVYVGQLAQEMFNRFTPEGQEQLKEELIALLELLMENEVNYTNEIYGEIGLVHDVKVYLMDNANKALMNLGFEGHYELEDDVNPIVLNGLKTDTKTFDFFSNKGNGYQKGIVKPITDATFAKVNEIFQNSLTN